MFAVKRVLLRIIFCMLQEMRISEVVDIMILHVENLKRTYQKEHAELEEVRYLISKKFRVTKYFELV